jgi:hypothetical protein
MMKYLIRLLTFGVILWAGGSAFAHGTSLKLDKKTAAPGETITIKGEGVGSNNAITLTLQGVVQDYSLGEAQGNEHGVFEKQVVLPGDVRPGNYTVVAAAGPSKATTKLAVTQLAREGSSSQEGAASGSQQHPSEQAGHGGSSMQGMQQPEHGGAGMEEANPEPMEIERSVTTAEKLVAWAMVLASAVLGVGLLFREKRE